MIEPTRPTDLGEFVAWVERMNADMLAAGVELGDRYDFDLVHGHDWLVAMACDHLARRFDAPLVMTVHATEHGRHQGWVDKHPQSHIHGVERWITNRADRVIACSFYMREQVADIFGVPTVCLQSADGAALGAALQGAYACLMAHGQQTTFRELCGRIVKLDEATRCTPDSAETDTVVTRPFIAAKWRASR